MKLLKSRTILYYILEREREREGEREREDWVQVISSVTQTKLASTLFGQNK